MLSEYILERQVKRCSSTAENEVENMIYWGIRCSGYISASKHALLGDLVVSLMKQDGSGTGEEYCEGVVVGLIGAVCRRGIER